MFNKNYNKLIMKKLKRMFSDILYVSKVTKTENKKILIITSVVLTQVVAYSDISIIVIFSAVLIGEVTEVEFVNNILQIFINNLYLLPILVVFRFLFQYYQKIILKKIENNVNKNLKLHILSELFEQKNYSTADSYFYLNLLTGHISFFYSSFANFLNNFLQIIVYLGYLIISNSQSVLALFLGGLIIYFPAKKLLIKARNSMHQVYESSQASNRDIQRVVDNLFLIKILKKENVEITNFESTLNRYFNNEYDNFRYGVMNSFLPSFFTLFSLAIVMSFSWIVKILTLDFIGVALRLFQSMSNVSTSLNQIINSHVHIEKFYQLEANKNLIFKENFDIQENSNVIIFNDVDFKYLNSEEKIFEKVNFQVKKNSHNLIIGPNGSGKSTLLGLIGGLYFPTDGKVSVFSDKFGFIGPNPLIFEGTLMSNIQYGNDKELKKSQVLEHLKKLDTFKNDESYDLDRKITNKSLSSGQMQKIAFIRAFLSDIDILLLDESTANLDEESSQKVFDMLESKNLTIVNSTHDMTKFKNVEGVIQISIQDQERKVIYKKLNN